MGNQRVRASTIGAPDSPQSFATRFRESTVPRIPSVTAAAIRPGTAIAGYGLPRTCPGSDKAVRRLTAPQTQRWDPLSRNAGSCRNTSEDTLGQGLHPGREPNAREGMDGHLQLSIRLDSPWGSPVSGGTVTWNRQTRRARRPPQGSDPSPAPGTQGDGHYAGSRCLQRALARRLG